MPEEKNLFLHLHHISKGAKFTSFAGWNMPVSYGSALNEHFAVRESVGLFDVSHMGEIEVNGSDSEAFLNYALTNDLRKCKVGQSQYSILCNEDGGTLDDLIIYRREKEKFFLCVNASNLESDYKVLADRSSPFNCNVSDLSPQYGQLALQGPSATSILSELIGEDLSQLKKMHFLEGNWMGAASIIARTGYTGEDGFEIYCSVHELEKWAAAFDQAQVPWIGLAARDSLRLEAGFPLYGHELSATITPVQAGLPWAIGWDKEDFCGADALRKERDGHLENCLIHYLVLDRRIPRDGCQILDPDDRVVGKVLSGGYSPLHQKPIGTALVQKMAYDEKSDSNWHALLRGNKIPIDIGLPALKRTL
jgi:aminomethyltransferase